MNEGSGEKVVSKNEKQQENFEKLLSTHHGRMIDFVKFAETKNAALLTFCTVWIGSIITLLRSGEGLPMGYNQAFVAALPFLVAAALWSLRSFLPRSLDAIHRDPERVKSLLYFADIASFKPEQYAQRFRERYGSSEGYLYTERYLDDLIVQTHAQAEIAHRKFKAFNVSALLVLLSFGILAFPVTRALVGMAARHGLSNGWW